MGRKLKELKILSGGKVSKKKGENRYVHRTWELW